MESALMPALDENMDTIERGMEAGLDDVADAFTWRN
jgi:hypothetical protein